MRSVQYESESEFAKDIIAYLQRGDWDVYQEVQPSRMGSVADIVATKGPVVWIIETKLTMNFAVIGQALNWRGRAHLISIATPWRKRSDSERYGVEYLLEPHGVGWMQASNYSDSVQVSQTVQPRFTRIREDRSIRHYLCEEQKTFAEAGTNTGGRFTPFQNTIRNAKRIIEQYPGVTAKDLIANIDHHYASERTAVSCIIKWTEAGTIKGIRMRREGRSMCFYTEEQFAKLSPIEKEPTLL